MPKTDVEPGLKPKLLEDIFKLMDAQTGRYERAVKRGSSKESPDLLVSEVYATLTKSKRDFYRPMTYADVSVGLYKFRGCYGKSPRAVFEDLLIELGFELYEAKGRAYRIKTVAN